MRRSERASRTQQSEAESKGGEPPPEFRPSLAAPSEEDGPTVFVHPGQVFTSTEACTVSTILGTCVAVCLWDPTTRAGGLNHFVLPHFAAGTAASPKYGNVAMRELLDRLIGHGIPPSRLQAKVFGGMGRGDQGGKDLGTANVELALKLLAEAGIPVISQDVGGAHGRRLLFRLSDGSAWVKHF